MNYYDGLILDLLAESSGRPAENFVGALELPPNAKNGDRAVPCFRWAKEEKSNPKTISEKWAKAIMKAGLPPEIEEVRAMGGYLNFFFEKSSLAKRVLAEIHADPDHYGFEKVENAPSLVLEFSSPNIAKPFSIGHLRTTNIGAALGRIFEARGWRVTRINHLGDWGTQFGKLISAYRRWGNAEMLEEKPINNLYKLYVRWHQEEGSDPTLIEEARDWFVRLEEGDEEATELWTWFRELTLKELANLYQSLSVEFDHYWGESHYRDQLEPVLRDMETKGITKISDEATIVELKDYGLATCVVKKSDDSSLYLTRDIAAAIFRNKQFEFDRMIYVVGAPQKLHFQQLFKILELMGHEFYEKCEHVPFGHMSFGDEAMSTRKGNIVFLLDVIDELKKLALETVKAKNPDLQDPEKVAEEVALGALLFADLSSKRIKDVRFTWENILSFEGETGPYLQYTLVRTKSLLRRYEGEIESGTSVEGLTSKEEMSLIRQLSLFPTVLEKAEREREPFHIAQYLISVAREFNRFYTKHRILDAEEDLTKARMLLVSGTSLVMSLGLKLLGIPCPEKM